MRRTGRHAMYYVYILKLNDSSPYVGFSEVLKNRIIDHQNGKCTTTKNKRPIELIWYCAFQDKYRALEFEKYLKKSAGIAFRNKHLI